MQKSICIIGILVTIMNISYSTNCINTIAIEAIQEEIKRGDIKKIAELCVDIKLTKIQHETLVSYAKKIASDHHNNIIRRNIKIYSATALKALGGGACDNSTAMLAGMLAGGLFDFRGIAAYCLAKALQKLKYIDTLDIIIGSILLFIEYKAWKSQSKVKNELDSKYDTALRIVNIITSLPVDEIAEIPQENIAT